MTEGTMPFTIESFYRYMKEKRILGAKCKRCGKITLPPRPMCPTCLSKDLEWKEISKQGKLVTYTVIHICPQQFQSFAPYAVGIVELENGIRLPGIIKDVSQEQIKIGMVLTVDFEEVPTTTVTWPQWARYHFGR